MSKISLSPSPTGSAVYTIASPAGSTDRTLTLPDTTAPILAGSGITLSASAPANTLVTDASGNVGIGTSSPVNYTGYKGLTVADTTGGFVYLRNTANSHQAELGLNGGGGFAYLATWTNSPIQFITNSTERMRIDSSGNLLVGTTTTAQTLSTNNVLTLKAVGPTAVWGVGPTTSFGNFYISTGGTGVALAGGSTSWGTVSDERQKDIIEPIVDAVQKIASLRAVIGKYKTDAEDARRSFLIAQDVQSVLPEAIDVGEDDAQTLSVKYTEVIPLLVAAIKELNAKVDAQAAEIAALKGQA